MGNPIIRESDGIDAMRRMWKLLGWLFLLSLCCNLLIELFSRKSIVETAGYVGGSFLVFLLNTIMLSAVFLPVLFTRRKWFLAAAIGAVVLSAGVVNGVLLIFRTTPFTASDLRLVKYAASLLNTYLSLWQIILGAAVFLAAVALCAWIWRRAPVDEEPVNRLHALCAAAVSLTVLWGSLELSIAGSVVALHFGNIGQAYREYGFVYCFANSLFNTGIGRPDTYGKEAVKNIRGEEFVASNIYSLQENPRPNIIMLQLESFFDPLLWENQPLDYDPVPFFRFLKKTYPSGYLSVPSVGAGTANTEFECITGMNLDFFGPGEYPYKTVLQDTVCESVAFDLKEIGYRTHAIHNNEGTFYDRNKVFPQLGFDTFTPIEYMYEVERNENGWCRDSILVGEISKTLDSSPGQDFIYTISVQGHGKYPSFEYYGEQIHEMDQFLRQLTEMLDKRHEPTVLVLYGDHLPGFEWTEDEMKNHSLFQTEYVIWNNLNLPDTRLDLEAYQLASHVLNLLQIHDGTMIRFHQRHLSAKNTDSEAYLNAMEVLEYDMLYGDREIYGGAMPYQATRMQMGITPIIQRTTTHYRDRIVVSGSHFNEYSTICVDGKALETRHESGRLLSANGIEYRAGEEITVQQIGRDKVPLGTAKQGPQSDLYKTEH